MYNICIIASISFLILYSAFLNEIKIYIIIIVIIMAETTEYFIIYSAEQQPWYLTVIFILYI